MFSTGSSSGTNTNAPGKEGDAVKETRISASRARTKPKYQANAAALLKRCRAFYQDPENEKAYHEWKAAKKKGA